MSKTIQKVFLLSFILNIAIASALYASCGCSGSSANCGDCGQTQSICCNSLCNGYPFLLPRSQGRDGARELVGWQSLINRSCMDSKYCSMYAAVEYQRNFWEYQIPRYYFGQDYVDCKHLYIQGSQVENRNEKAWLADYFGLPVDYESKVSFCPRIQNAIVDLGLFVGLDNLTPGLYLKFGLPIVWTKWELCPCEVICKEGIKPFEAGYMDDAKVLREDMSTSFLSYMGGEKTFGDMQSPIKYGLIKNQACKITRPAEFRTVLGYNFVLDQDYHFGFFFHLSAPTGNRPCATYLFEPIIGNGKHWEVGGGISGSWIFHRNCECEDRYVGIWLDFSFAHLAKSCQRRSFDLACKTNGRYLLLEKMGPNDDEIQTEAGTNASYQYQKQLIPAINFTTRCIDVRIDLQADLAIKLGFVRDNYSLDIGYNLWARTGENFEQNCDKTDPTYCYAIKGDAYLYGRNLNDEAFALSASQSEADIHAGKNWPKLNNNDDPQLNPRIDDPQEAFQGGADQPLFALSLAKTHTTHSSFDPYLLNKRDLDLQDSPSGLTHKVFIHLGYTGNDNNDECDTNVTPFIGIGGEVEFAHHRCKENKPKCTNPSCDKYCAYCCCNTDPCEPGCICDDCCDNSCNKRMGISQWGVWVKAGFGFH